ncbi:MAG: ribonuclease activity regulator RraA [Bacteroidota bacterium]
MKLATREKLNKTSTATIATILFKQGLKNQFIQNVGPVVSGKSIMVGEAFTLRYIPAREDLNPISVFKDPRHLQRVAIETCPSGAVLIMDSRKDARAASAGSMLITRLMHRGAAGVVTDGGFRDSAIIGALPFPSFHQRPSAPTNLTLHQAIDLNVPIACGDVAVFPGDVLVGDDDGVMVIPAHLADLVAEEAMRMELYEAYVGEQVSQGQSIIGLYPLTQEKHQQGFDHWKQSRDLNKGDE